MAQYPATNDSKFNLVFKTAVNWYDQGIALSLSGFNPPNINDTIFVLRSKIAYYTARIADAS